MCPTLPSQLHPGTAVRAQHVPLPWHSSVLGLPSHHPQELRTSALCLPGWMSLLNPCPAWQRCPGCSNTFESEPELAVRVRAMRAPCDLPTAHLYLAVSLAASPWSTGASQPQTLKEVGLSNISFCWLQQTHALLPSTSRPGTAQGFGRYS